MKMAVPQLLNHRDSTYAENTLLRLNKLRQDGILCDVTVLVQGKEFKAHKAVLAASSDYFLNALCGGKSTSVVRTDRTAGHMTIELEHVTVRGFTPLLEYSYTATLQVNATDVIDVLQAASFLQMSKVSTACSEFMRSNILWSQSLRPGVLASLPNMQFPHLKSTSPKPASKEEELRAIAAAMAASGTRDVSSLFTNSANLAAAGRNLGQPPMLIPMRGMSYEAGLQQWAASMAGTQNFLARVSSSQFGAESLANGSTPMTSSITTWPTSTEKSKNTNAIDEKSIRNGRKSEAYKMESQSDGESPGRFPTNGATSPAGSNASEPTEDSWQALQKLYSMRANGISSPRDGASGTRSGSNTPVDIDRSNNVNSPPSREHSRPHSRENQANSNINNNNNNTKMEGIADFIGKMKAGLLSSENISRLSPAAAAAAAMAVSRRLPVTSMQNALLQQQQLLAQHGTTSNENNNALPMADLPVVPANGQYMSVRRRTLQSNVPKPHQCQICGSRFTRFHNLKQHIKLHSGIKPYECDECGKRFTRNYTLRLHKMKHVGIRNFRCGTCDASFTSLGEFRAHLRMTMHSHSGALGGDSSPTMNNTETEDMSNVQKTVPAAAMSRYSAFDPSMLGIGANSVAHAAYLRNGGAGVDQGSAGDGSPQLSERSMSPQDLSAKNSDNQKMDYRESGYSDRHSDEEDRNHGNEENKETRCASMSPNSDRFVSSGAESANKSAISDDAEEADLVIDHQDDAIDHQDDVTSDRPMSLVVDASA